MADFDPSAPVVQSAQKQAAAQGKLGLGKFISVLVCGWVASYFMNYASLHGINFETSMPGITVSSEVVKSTIEATLEAAVAALTPNHFLASLIDAIRWFKSAGKQINDAWKDPSTQ